MTRPRAKKAALALAFAATALAAPAAHASVTIGQVAANPDRATTCGPGSLGMQALQQPSAATDVPAGGGIVTEWRAAGLTTAASPDVALAVWRADPDPDPRYPGLYEFVGGSVPETLPQGTTGVFQTRFPVQGGDVLGLDVRTGNAPCAASAPSGRVTLESYTNRFGQAPFTELFQFAGLSVSPARLNLAVTIEADADGDGFGDETQDLCPADPARQSCPPPPVDTPVTPDPGAGTTPTPGAGTTPTPGAGTPVPPTPSGSTPKPSSPSVTVLKLPKFTALRGAKARGAFTASAAGRIAWTGRAGRTVVTSGSKSLAKGKHPLALSLNTAGKRLLKRSRTLKVAVTFTFAPKGGKPARGVTTITFKR